MDDDNQFCVKWRNHHGTLVSVLETLLSEEAYVDCTLSAEGREISAHKVVLSACSPYLSKLLKKHYDRHPILILKDVSFFDLQNVIDYMYKGEVNVEHSQLSSFLKTAEMLQVMGLSGVYKSKSNQKYSKVLEFQDDGDDNSESSSPEVKRCKVEELSEDDSQDGMDVEQDEGKIEKIEYLSEEQDETQTGTFQEILDDYGNYQLYIVDETGSLNEMAVEEKLGEVLEEGQEKENDGKVPAEVIKDLQQLFNDAEDNEKDDKPPLKKGKLVPEKIATVTNRPKIKPRSYIHRDDYNISCNDCGGLYKHESSYLNHLRHDCNQIHTCTDCQKTFKNKRHLLDHVRDDCGRVHVCPRCRKYFKQKVNLTTHMKHYCKSDKSVRNVEKPSQ